MSSVHPTRHICHSSTVEGRRCYILRAIFLRGSPRLSWGFIGVSLPHATVVRGEVGAWRLVLSHYIASPYPQPPGSSLAIFAAVSCELGFRMRIYPPPVAYPS